jgi:hypothetical protein
LRSANRKVFRQQATGDGQSVETRDFLTQTKLMSCTMGALAPVELLGVPTGIRKLRKPADRAV